MKLSNTWQEIMLNGMWAMSRYFALKCMYISQGWHGKKNQPIKPGFFGWFFLVFFKRNLKKPGFYWVFSKFLVFL